MGQNISKTKTDKNQFNHKEYQKIRRLGKGGNASVYLMVNKNNKKKKCAMKIIDTMNEDDYFLDYVKSEIKLL